MNPSPTEQWLRDYCVKVCGALPDQPIAAILLRNPVQLPHSRLNPIEQPSGVQFPFWFDSRSTPTGQRLGSALGESSGFFQEYLNWAPSVSWLYDLVAHFCQLIVHPQTLPAVREVLFPYFHGFASILELQLSLIQIHSVHGEHHGTALDGTWKALQTQIRLQATTNQYRPGLLTDTLDRINKELLSQ